jgi:hypothetical protein
VPATLHFIDFSKLSSASLIFWFTAWDTLGTKHSKTITISILDRNYLWYQCSFFGIGNKISQHLRFMKMVTHSSLKTTPTGMVLEFNIITFHGMRMMINVHRFRPQCGVHLCLQCHCKMLLEFEFIQNILFSASVGHSTLIQQLETILKPRLIRYCFYKSSHFNILCICIVTWNWSRAIIN